MRRNVPILLLNARCHVFCLEQHVSLDDKTRLKEGENDCQGTRWESYCFVFCISWKNMLTGGKPAPWMADLPEELGYDDGA